MNFQIQIAGFAPGFSFFPHPCQPNALTFADAGRDFDHQFFGLAAKIIRIWPSLQCLLRSQIKMLINIGAIYGELDAADFLQH